MNNTKVLFCPCKHAFQDKRYGKNKRLHNRTEKQDGDIYRCTVCESEKRK